MENDNNDNKDKENKYYNENIKKAIYKHRDNNRPAYNERQRNYYAKLSDDPDWKQRFNERCREANRKYREKKRLEVPPRPRGRPRKIPETPIGELIYVASFL